MKDTGIIRNKLKINVAIYNTRAVLGLQKEYGSFEIWLGYHHPKTKVEWVQLFKFTGGEITKEFLMSTGYIEGAHSSECPAYEKLKDFTQNGHKEFNHSRIFFVHFCLTKLKLFSL